MAMNLGKFSVISNLEWDNGTASIGIKKSKLHFKISLLIIFETFRMKIYVVIMLSITTNISDCFSIIRVVKSIKEHIASLENQDI